jgi:hypothetical protein
MSTSTVEIKGKEYVSKAARDAAAALKLLGEESKGAFSGVVVTAGDVVRAVKAVAATVNEFITEYAEQERAILTFNAAMKTSTQLTSSSAASLREYASAIALKTGADDEAVLSMTALLATSGRTEEEIKKLISAAADMSVVTGKDLRTSVEELNKTFSGSEGRLNTLIPALKDLTEEELKSGAAIDIVAKQYGGLADELGGSMSVRIENFKNSLDDLKAAIAGAFAPVASPFLTFVESIISKWTTAISEMNRYRELSKKGEKRTAEEELEKVVLELKMTRTAQVNDIKTLPGLGFFDQWLQTMQLSGDARYQYKNPDEAGQARERAAWTKDWAKLVDAYKQGPIQQAFIGKIDQLTEKAEALRGQLKALESDSGAVGGTATGDALLGYADENANTFENFVSSLQDVNYQFAKDIETAMKEGVKELGYQQQDPGMGVGGIGHGGQADYRNSDPAKGGPGNISDLIQDYPGSDVPAIDTSFLDGLGNSILSVVSNMGQLGEVVMAIVAASGPIGLVILALTKIFEGIMQVLAPVINSLLAPLFGQLNIIGQLIGQLLIPVFNMLTPVIQAFTEMFVFSYNLLLPIFEFFSDSLNMLADGMSIAINFIMLGVWKMLEWIDDYINIGKGFGGKADAAKAATKIDPLRWFETQTLQKIDLEDVIAAGGSTVTGGVVPTTSGAAASYSAPRDITVNVTINTEALVGEGGIRDFSLMIGRELRSAGVLGMA